MTDESSAIKIPVRRLLEHCDPYRNSPWGIKIRKSQVKCAVEKNRLNPEPYEGMWTSRHHAERIAFFVKNGWKDPIELDVGIPFLGYHADWMVYDGNHRFSAAIFMNKRFILANLSGDVDYAEELFFK